MIVPIIHRATWATWAAKGSALLAALLAVVPALAPRDLADWFASQAPLLPSWSHWAAAGLIVTARIGIAAWRIIREEVP